MLAVALTFWVAIALVVYAQVGYPLALALLVKLTRRAVSVSSSSSSSSSLSTAGPGTFAATEAPTVTAIVAAYNEQDVIAQRVANLRALHYPPERLQVIVASDGSTDETAQRARAAGADQVLELPRGGKIRAQDAAVAVATGEVLAFSDANATWEPDALGHLIAAFLSQPAVGYVCGEVTFTDDGGRNQEGLYWRYEMWLRRMESRLLSVTSGNGAIYATRREAYIHVDPTAGHDLSFPAGLVKRGRRAIYVPAAKAREKMAPSIEREFVRKRRMARRTWPATFAAGLISPRGYPPLYAWMILSHRVLRYLVPFLHVIALAANLALLTTSPVYIVTLVVQVALVTAAALAGRLPSRPLLVARYYVVTNAALAAGLWDWLGGDRAPTWETVEGTR